MNRYDRYPGDYMRDTTELSLAEDGAYTRLLDWYYANERPIDATRVFAVARANSEEDRRITQWVLSRFFRSETQHGVAVWVNDRAEREIAKARPRIIASRKNGQLGGRPGKSSKNPDRIEPWQNPVGNLDETQQDTQWGTQQQSHTGEGEGGASPGGHGGSPRIPSGARDPVSVKEANQAAEEFERGVEPPDGGPPMPRKVAPPEATSIAEILAGLIAGWQPTNRAVQPDRWVRSIATWALDLDAAHRLDKRSWADLERVVRWAHGDSFWRPNILSGRKVREQYDKLDAASRRPNANRNEAGQELRGGKLLPGSQPNTKTGWDFSQYEKPKASQV